MTTVWQHILMYSSNLIIQGDLSVHAGFMCLVIFNADFWSGNCQDVHVSCTVLISIIASPFPAVKANMHLLLYCLTWPGRLFKVKLFIQWWFGKQVGRCWELNCKCNINDLPPKLKKNKLKGRWKAINKWALLKNGKIKWQTDSGNFKLISVETSQTLKLWVCCFAQAYLIVCLTLCVRFHNFIFPLQRIYWPLGAIAGTTSDLIYFLFLID